MFFACEGKRPPPFQCSVVLGARQLTDVTCARLFALPDGEFLQPLDVGFPASSFFCSITPTSAANNMNANISAFVFLIGLLSSANAKKPRKALCTRKSCCKRSMLD